MYSIIQLSSLPWDTTLMWWGCLYVPITWIAKLVGVQASDRVIHARQKVTFTPPGWGFGMKLTSPWETEYVKKNNNE
jgi:glyoxylate carboligase